MLLYLIEQIPSRLSSMFICLESYETKLTKVNRSKAKHAKDRNDWEWWNPCVPDRLRELDSQGYVNMGRGREEGRGGGRHDKLEDERL